MRTFDIVQESFDHLWRAWPLILVMAAETLFVTVLMLVPFFPAIAALVGAYPDADLMIELMETWVEQFTSSPLLIFQTVLIFVAIGLVASVIHIFFVGGLARVLHESITQKTELTPSSQIRGLFSAGRRLFLPTLLIYSITWGVAAIVALVPVLPLVAYLALEEDYQTMIIAAAAGLILWISLLVLVAILTRAVTSAALGRMCHAPEDVMGVIRSTLASASSEIGSFLKLSLAASAIVIGAGFVSGSFDLFAGFTGAWLPVGILIEVVTSVVGIIVSAGSGVWFLIAFLIWEHSQRPDADGKAFASGDA